LPIAQVRLKSTDPEQFSHPGRISPQETLVDVVTELYLLGWELATRRVVIQQGVRKGIYVNYQWLRDIDHLDRYKKDGSGPRPKRPDVEFGNKESRLKQKTHQYKDVFEKRTPQNVAGVIEGGLVKVGGQRESN